MASVHKNASVKQGLNTDAQSHNLPQMQVIVGWEWPEEGITKMQVPEHAQSNCFPLAYLHCQSSFTLFHCQLVLTQGNLTQ